MIELKNMTDSELVEELHNYCSDLFSDIYHLIDVLVDIDNAETRSALANGLKQLVCHAQFSAEDLARGCLEQGERARLAQAFRGAAGQNERGQNRTVSDDVRYYIYGRMLGLKHPIPGAFIPRSRFRELLYQTVEFCAWIIGTGRSNPGLSSTENADKLFDEWQAINGGIDEEAE